MANIYFVYIACAITHIKLNGNCKYYFIYIRDIVYIIFIRMCIMLMIYSRIVYINVYIHILWIYWILCRQSQVAQMRFEISEGDCGSFCSQFNIKSVYASLTSTKAFRKNCNTFPCVYIYFPFKRSKNPVFAKLFYNIR